MVRLDADDTVRVIVGTHSNGQGHETAYAQMVADRLGVDFDRIVARTGRYGMALARGVTAGSRSIPVGGRSAAVIAADEAVQGEGEGDRRRPARGGQRHCLRAGHYR